MSHPPTRLWPQDLSNILWALSTGLGDDCLRREEKERLVEGLLKTIRVRTDGVFGVILPNVVLDHPGIGLPWTLFTLDHDRHWHADKTVIDQGTHT